MDHNYFSNREHFWWDEKTQPHEPLQAYVRRVRSDQRYRSTDNLKYLRLYGNQRSMGLGLTQYAKTDDSSQHNRVTLNIVQSMVDTAVSKITKNQPKPMYLTDGGDWSEQRKAKKLNKFTQGQFYHADIYSKGAEAFRDSCVFGTGVLKIFKKNNDVCVERVFIDDITVDDAESIYGSPRQLHYGMWVHKDVLKAKYAKKDPQLAQKIEELGSKPIDEGSWSLNYQPGMVRVLESWHLPSEKKAKDGRYVVSIDGATLEDSKYTKDYFPFVFIKWSPKLLGFFGQGLAEQLQGLQIEINKILRTIQLATHLLYIPRVLIERNSQVVSEHINNRIGAKVYYTGVKPEVMQTSGALPPELFNHLDRLYQRAFEITGISQLSAQSKKPGGLDSGKALRTFSDIESERFLDVGRRYEQFYMEVAERMLDVARDIGDYKVKVPGKKFIETMNIKDINLSEDRYIMQAFPTNALSKIPSARLAEVQEMMNAGLISPDVGRKLLDFPDLQAETDRENAAQDDLDWTIDYMLENDEYLPPESYQNLEMGIPHMQNAYLELKKQGAPEDKLELLRAWIADAEEKVEQIAAEKAAEMQMAQEEAMEQMQQQKMQEQMQQQQINQAVDAQMLQEGEEIPPEALAAMGQ